MNNPFFSVIIPTHNAEDWIRKCLWSIYEQTFTDYELIIVCDSCTDDTEQIAKKFCRELNVANPHNHRVLTSDAHHDGMTRNFGLDDACGKYVLFADDDDWFLHEYAFQFAHDAIHPDTDVLAFGFIWKHRGYGEPVRHANGANIYYPAVWNKAYRRDFIADLRFLPIPNTLTTATDQDWTARLLADEPNIDVLDQPLYYYNYLRWGSQTDYLVNGGDADDS